MTWGWASTASTLPSRPSNSVLRPRKCRGLACSKLSLAIRTRIRVWGFTVLEPTDSLGLGCVLLSWSKAHHATMSGADWIKATGSAVQALEKQNLDRRSVSSLTHHFRELLARSVVKFGQSCWTSSEFFNLSVHRYWFWMITDTSSPSCMLIQGGLQACATSGGHVLSALPSLQSSELLLEMPKANRIVQHSTLLSNLNNARRAVGSDSSCTKLSSTSRDRSLGLRRAVKSEVSAWELGDLRIVDMRWYNQPWCHHVSEASHGVQPTSTDACSDLFRTPHPRLQT